MAVTIKDIAKAAGVSATTVSRVVNNRVAGISDAKRKEIQNLIQEMGYHPNSIARGLVTKRTNALGIILPNIIDPFFAEIARGAQDTAEKLGYIVILINTDDVQVKQNKAIQLLKEQCVDGIMLYASSTLREQAQPSILLDEGTPVVLLGHHFPSLQVPAVYLDYQKGMGRMTEMLLQKGHRSIVYMAGMSVNPELNEGIQGYLHALTQHGVQPQKQLICNGGFRLEGAKAVLGKLLDDGDRFTAVICENDLMAAGVLEELEKRGIHVPDEISVTGFDNTFFSRLTNPKLTTLDFPKYEMGQEAVRLLLELIQSGEADAQSVELTGDIIERASVKQIIR